MLTNHSNPRNPVIIGIDHGYGNIKTAHTCFQTGVTRHEGEPVFKQNLLKYEDTWYTIGMEHKAYTEEKMQDQDYFLLTLAAIASELAIAGRQCADVHLAVGLPLTWVTGQKEAFRRYLMQKSGLFSAIDFNFKGVSYQIRIIGVDVFPQGFAAVVKQLPELRGVNMLCDIGNGTMNIMYINNGQAQINKCSTEKYGTYQCVKLARDRVMQEHRRPVDEAVIEEVIRTGTADISEKYLKTIQSAAKDYAEGIMRRLRENDYNPDLMKLYVVGGGGCLIRNFGNYDQNRVIIIDDICAAAKGYEYMTMLKMQKAGDEVS